VDKFQKNKNVSLSHTQASEPYGVEIINSSTAYNVNRLIALSVLSN